MKAFDEQKIENHIQTELEKWSYEKQSLTRDFKFKTFVEAFGFMASVALEAEKLNHHPDWSNSYNKVHIATTTHDADGITQLDFDLASKIDQIFDN